MSRASLNDWLSYLEQLHPQAIDLGLDRVRWVAERLGIQRPAPRVITVTGTNGKGSTCAFLSQLLQAQGWRVGVYSSPHLLRYNERVCINGQMVTDAALCQAFEQIEQARGDTSLTYFEFGTLAALLIFQAADLGAVILEVGLGGRLDAVNLVDPDVAVVTSIGLDHTEWLGNTRESVAQEKAGIFRPGIPVVCGDPNPPATLLAAALELNAPIWIRGQDYGLERAQQSWCWWGSNLQGSALAYLDLPALSLPLENAACALQALALIPGVVWPEHPELALKATQITGRLDRRVIGYQGRKLSLMLDVGHNPHAALYLSQQLSALPSGGQRYALFGLLQDKDLEAVLQPLLPLIDHWAVVALDTARTRSADELYQALHEKGASVCAYASIQHALKGLLPVLESADELLVFGSFYAVADALKELDSIAQEHLDDMAG